MFVCDMKWIDFVVRCQNPYQLFIERIVRDDTVITHAIKKLECFYFKIILPELASPRYNLVPGIRECENWVIISFL